MSKYEKCTTCPNTIGDTYRRDCAFPDCCGWNLIENAIGIWEYWYMQEKEKFESVTSEEALYNIAKLINEDNANE